MRIKTPLLAAVVALRLLELSCCSGIVGYVNVPLPPGYSFVANPLDNNDNGLNTIIPEAPDGTRTYVWSVTDQVFLPPATFHTNTIPPGWTTNFDLPPGKGFVLFVPYSWKHTFVGTVLEGWLTNFVAGGSKFSLIGNMPPVSSSMSGIRFPRLDGGEVFLFRRGTQKFSNAYNYFHGFGWFDPDGADGTNGPLCTVAESFFVRNPGPDTNWIQNFNVPRGIALPSSLPVSQASAGPMIEQIVVASGMVTLRVENPGGQPYDVQFSTDGREWVTVATNQVSELWVSPVRNATCGYYKISNR